MPIKLSDPAADIYMDGRVKETTVLEAIDAASRDALARMEALIFVPKLEGPPAKMSVVLRSTPAKAMNPFVRWANPRDIMAGDRIVIGVDGELKPDGPGQSYVVQSVDTRGINDSTWADRWHTFSMGCHVHKEPCGLCSREYLGAFVDLKDREDALFSREDIDRARKAGAKLTTRQLNDALHLRRPPTGKVIEDPVVRLENWLADRPVIEPARTVRFPAHKRGGMTPEDTDDMMFASVQALPPRKKSP